MSPRQGPLRDKAIQALLEKVCQDFGVDPSEVTNVELCDGKITFERAPLVFDVPADYRASVTVPA